MKAEDDGDTRTSSILSTTTDITENATTSTTTTTSRRPSLKPLLDWKSHGKLFDRRPQELALQEAYRRSVETVELVLITGASGTGKTALADTLLSHVQADGGFFCRGKFDQNQYVTTHSPVFRAFSSFAKRVIARGEPVATQVKCAIEQELGTDVDILLELIPELVELLAPEQYDAQHHSVSSTETCLTCDDASETTSGGGGNELGDVDLSESQGRVVSVFRRFFRSISHPDRPIVLMLDDLQWADDITLALLAARLNESGKGERTQTGAMLLGTCRGNEVKLNDRLASILREIEEDGVRITDIKVDNLSTETLADMVSTVLDLSVHECMPLAEAVYLHTQGNPFFSIQYLRSLQEEGTLYQNDDERWAWKEEGLIVSHQESAKDDKIVRLVGDSIKGQMGAEAIEILKVAACLGGDFTEELLVHSGAATSPQQVVSAFHIAEERGLIVFDYKQGTGRFTHDKFQESAYALIPNDQRASFHLNLGRSLRRELSPRAIRKHFSLIFNQIKLGIDEMDDPDEREEMAHLCLRAARKAGKASSFASGSEYAEIGIMLLSRRHWRDQYSLSLDLYNSAAELSYCVGKHDRVDELVKSVVANATSSEDKLQAHGAKILSLAALQETSAAIAYCIEVLRRLGQPFPRKPKLRRIFMDYVKTRRKLSNLSDDEILSLPKLTDPKTNAAMVFIHQLFPLVQREQYEYSPIIAFRLVHLTLKHGLSSISSVAFAFYGAILSRFGRTNEGYRFMKLAFRVLDLYPSDRWMTRCLLLSCVAIASVVEPLRDSIKPLMTGHQLGLKCGDLETGFICAIWHCVVRMLVGDPLSTVSRRLLQLIELCRDYNQFLAVNMATCVHNVCRSLMGETKDPLVFTDEEERLQDAAANNRTMLLVVFAYFKHMVATYYNRYDVAVSIARTAHKLERGFATPIPAFAMIQSFHEGLVATELARRSRSRGHLRVARKRLRSLREAVLMCPENALHKAYLLEAEILAVEGRYDDAMCKYEQSIAYAKKSQFIGEEGLANEKTARMLWKRQDSRVVYFLAEAQDSYSRWGAQKKVTEMEDMIAKWNNG